LSIVWHEEGPALLAWGATVARLCFVDLLARLSGEFRPKAAAARANRGRSFRSELVGFDRRLYSISTESEGLEIVGSAAAIFRPLLTDPTTRRPFAENPPSGVPSAVEEST
jgi:hypothetical protein